MNIDTSTIENFDSLSAEEKVDALLKLDLPDSSAELAKMKSALDKATSEAADYKKQLKGKLTEDEAAAAEREAKWAEMEAKLKELETEKTISTYKASYLSMPGFDEKLAEETAKALAAGDMEKVFEKKLRADLVKQDPKPDGAGGDDQKKDTAVEFAKKLGKQRADALKSANEGLKNYF